MSVDVSAWNNCDVDFALLFLSPNSMLFWLNLHEFAILRASKAIFKQSRLKFNVISCQIATKSAA